MGHVNGIRIKLQDENPYIYALYFGILIPIKTPLLKRKCQLFDLIFNPNYTVSERIYIFAQYMCHFEKYELIIKCKESSLIKIELLIKLLIQ